MLNCKPIEQLKIECSLIFTFLDDDFSIDKNFDFRPEFRFSTKISIFDLNFDFRPKFRFLT